MARSSILMLMLLVGTSWAEEYLTGDTAMHDERSFEYHLRRQISHFEQPRYPLQQYRQSWLSSRAHVFEQFRQAGLDPRLECWNTTIPGSSGFDSVEEVRGCNVVGQITGENEEQRLVIGASYDSGRSPYNNRPLRENGAGIATVIEVAKTFWQTIRFKDYAPKYTTVFVAFDLEYAEKSYSQFQDSRRGSDFFVEKHLKNSKDRLRGAFILDSISTFTSNENTQSLPSDFGLVFPEGFSEIRGEHKGRGDFLAAIAVKHGEQVLDLFQTYFEKKDASDSRTFRMQKLVTANTGEGRTHRLLSSFSAQPFWDNSAPAILLTDTTESLRMLPFYDQCGEACLIENFLEPQRRHFLYTTYRSLFQTLMKKQTVPTESSGADSLSQMSCLISVLTCGVVSLLLSQRR